MTESPTRKLAAIMFTDMVGYTALMQKDESKARELIQRHRDLMKPHIDKHNGDVLQYVGDATFCVFNSAIEAVNAAVEIQKVLELEDDINLRIGIHIGDVVAEGDEVYGDGVNVASRLEPLANPGGICVSHQVYENIKNQSDLKLESIGEQTLKNVDEPIEVFVVTKEAPAVEQPLSPKEKSSRKTMYSAMAVIIIIVGFLAYLNFNGESGSTSNFSARAVSKASIAVLPFRNMSSDPENEYFSDGMTEEIINALTTIKGLRVAARTSSFMFKGDKIDIREVGEKLNVKTVLEGSVRKSGAKLRITAQLINIEDGYHIWSEVFEREMADIFAIQDEIARSIANRLKIEFSGSDEILVTERHTENIEAYNLYLKGRFHCLKNTKNDVNRGIEYLNFALNIDPDYAVAYAEMANCYSTIGYFHGDMLAIRDAYLKATDAAESALKIDNDLAEAHASLAYIKRTYHWDWKGAEIEFKRAIELNPNLLDARWLYALHLTAVGRLDEAVREAKIALELDPISHSANLTLARIFYYGRRYDEAITQSNILLEMDPNFSGGHSVIANVYEQLGRYDEAIDRYVLSGSLTGSNVEFFWDAHQTFEITGWKDYWQKVLEWVDSNPEAKYIPSITKAVLYTRLGQNDKALDQLEASYEKREGELVYINVNPRFDSLRSDPRFTEILKKMGLE